MSEDQSVSPSITTFKSTTDTIGVRRSVETWHKIFTAFQKAKPPKTSEKKHLQGWSPATFTNDTRKKANVEQVFALVLDYDDGGTTPLQALEVWAGQLACTYTSWSHTPEKPRFRVVVPFTRGVTAAEYQRVWRAAKSRVLAAGQQIDQACKDPSRLWYLPCKRDDSFEVVVQDGDALDVDQLLLEHGGEILDGPIESFEAIEANPSYGKSALDRECAAVAGTAEGGRNTALNKAAFSLGQLVASDVLEEALVITSLLNAASSSGLPTEEAERTIRAGMDAGKQQPRSTSLEVATSQDEPWATPQPLSEDIDVPPSPWATCLPAWLWQWVEAEAVATQTPDDLSALLALAVLATCAQSRWQVQIKDGWKEPLCIYTAVILPPGSRKSAVYRAATAPLYDWETAQRLAIEAEATAATTTVAIAEKKLRAAEAKAGKDGDITAKDEALEAARELADAQAEVPTMPRLVTADATQEAVARLLDQQGGSISVMDAEGCGPVALMLGRYSDGAAAVDVYLRGHAGDALRVDRASREPIIVDHPRITMGITVQPAVVEQLSERRELRGLGLLARILWCHPHSNVGNRLVDPPPMPSVVMDRYRRVVEGLLEQPKPSDDEPAALLELSHAAWVVLRDFMEELEPRLGVEGDLHPIADWASKLAGAVARIAGLLHVAKHFGVGHDPIGADTITSAVTIGRYLLAHSQKVLGQMGGADPTLVDAKAILSHLRRRKVQQISRRDLHQALRKGHDGRFQRADDLDAPINLLVERGWVRLKEQRDGGGKGRTSVVISVNPLENGTPQKPQKAQKVTAPDAPSEPARAIEPIEAFEANRAAELECVMTVVSSTAGTTPPPKWERNVITGEMFDVSTPELENAFRDALMNSV